MDQLDAMLSSLARAPLPSLLNSIDEAVLARIAASTAGAGLSGLSALTIGAALTMGMIGAVLPKEEAGAAAYMSPPGSMSPIAPSVLLSGEG